MKFNYKETFKVLPRFIISVLILVIMLSGFNKILPIDTSSRLVQIFNLALSGVVCGGVYLLINFKHIKILLPQKLLKKLRLSN